MKEAREEDVIVTAKDPLQRLRDEFERELSVLRTADAPVKLREIFDASPEEMADAANAAASHNAE